MLSTAQPKFMQITFLFPVMTRDKVGMIK